MPTSAWSAETQSAIDLARTRRTVDVMVSGQSVTIPFPFPSPADWRDYWIYEILVDRFNNPAAPPRTTWDGTAATFQGGTLEGIRRQLDYLSELGAGALWLTPVLKNCAWNDGSYHGYGIMDFLTVDPRFASDPDAARANPALAEAELRALVDEAHARGMYVILDIVLNHTGDVFEYPGHGATAPWSDTPYPSIEWRDGSGHARPDWTQPPADPGADGAVWPEELRAGEYFRRQGNAFTDGHDPESGGDFFSLKQLAPNYRPAGSPTFPVRDTLIRAYQYVIARFDVDGFRIDTLKYLPPDFAQVFGNAIREFALSIGKQNFFSFGEVYDSETKIAGYIGRNACSDSGDLVGVDAALDFPLFFKLPMVAKGLTPPSDIVSLFEYRKLVERGILSSHGEASRFFVTFLDNHDQHNRFYYRDPADPHRYDDQVTLGAGLLFSLQGIPCLYYGTEQGLSGAGDALEAVREALWGRPGGLDRTHPFFKTIRDLSAARLQQPALRYGRQYFRPISGDGEHYGVSTLPPGVVAFSRILQDEEVVVVANTNRTAWTGEVIVDLAIDEVGAAFTVCFSNQPGAGLAPPGAVVEKGADSVEVHEVNGSVTRGPIHVLPVSLRGMEIQILSRPR